MILSDAAHGNGFFEGDTWLWWQARRLRYNLTLAVGGVVAYGAAVALNYAFGHPVWSNWREALGMMLFLGAAYLIVMGFANVCYLLGPAVEAWVKPRDVDRYRRNAFAMGAWGSLIVPFSFPLVQLSVLIATS
jgi:hypothetical protein